jgi:hypothetical protein
MDMIYTYLPAGYLVALPTKYNSSLRDFGFDP